MKGWNSFKLEECANILSGGTPSKTNENYWSGNLPWVSSGEMTEHRLRDTSLHITLEAGEKYSKIVKPLSILVVVRGMSLAKEFRVSIALNNLSFNQDIKGIIPKNGVYPWFLFYSLFCRKTEIRKLSSESGHGTKKIDTKVLKDIEVPLPPIPIQKKISATLSAYDELIENNNRRIAILEKMAEEIYREWFVRMRFPGHEKVKVVKGVPEGWEICELSKLYNISYGKNLPTDQIHPDGKFPVYGAGSIIGYYEKSNTDKKSVLITCRGNGSGTVWRTKYDRTFVTNNSFIINAVYDDDSFVYSFLHLKYSSVHQALTGSAQPQITISNLSKIKVIKHDICLIKNFQKMTSHIFEQIDDLDFINNKLKQSRDLLLPRLISGKLDVENLDIDFPPGMQSTELTDGKEVEAA